MDLKIERMPIRASELDWLRWFYANVGPLLGPAEDEVREEMKRAFEKATGYRPAAGYDAEEET